MSLAEAFLVCVGIGLSSPWWVKARWVKRTFSVANGRFKLFPERFKAFSERFGRIKHSKRSFRYIVARFFRQRDFPEKGKK